MIKDRLEELTISDVADDDGGVTNEAYDDDDEVTSKSDSNHEESYEDIEKQEKQAQLEAAKSAFIEEHQLKPSTATFLSSVVLIHDQMVNMLDNITVLKSYHQQALASVEIEPDLSDKIEDINGEIKLEARKVRSKLKTMKTEVNEISTEEKGGFDHRCLSGHHLTMAKAFAETMKLYQDAQRDYQSNVKRRIKRQLKVTSEQTDIDDAKVDELVERIGQGEDVQMFAGFDFDEEQTRQIESRHNDLLELEKSIVELAEMFSEMSAMIADQGQTLMRVEDSIQNAQEYVEKAKAQTAKAVEHQKSSNKKCCCCIGLLAVLAAVIAISLAISLT